MHTRKPPSSVPRRDVSRVDGDPLSTVVWVRGEQDASTCAALSVTLAEASGVDDADIVVDLSGVTFMDASTLGALVGAGNRLGVLSRCLSVRAPSPQARRVLDLCGLGRLIDEHPTPTQPPRATALGSWVDVPARDRDPSSAQTPVAHETSPEESVCVMARRRVEPARVIAQRRVPL